MTRNEYNQKRQQIISANRSKRMRGLPTVAVPQKLKTIYGYQIVDAEGTYVGFTFSPTQAKKHRENGYKIKRKPALYTGRFPITSE